ncbi:MAG: hypothetical protein JKY30_10615 [Flavobacteriales bacterium]|nr:hypothetical protein [Flavobacteriales bacterium]
MPSVQTFLLFVIFSIALIGCQGDEPTKEGSADLTYTQNDKINFIKPPFLDRDIEQEIFMIDAQKDEELITEAGSKIKVYKNTIVDANGDLVKGEVKIEYRDFHNPLEIYLSGIPMEYDSAGIKYVFETAGMFELKAYQNGEMLNLKMDKKMDVDLISTSNETDFNFYSFNEAKGVWSYEDESMKIITTPKNKTQEKEEAKSLIKPIVHKTTNYAFKIDVNKKQYPELEAYEGTIFEVKGKGSFNPIYYNIQWDKVEIDCKNRSHYVLELFKEDTSIFVDVKPVIKTEKYNQAITKYKKQKKNQEENLEERNDFDVYVSQSISFNSSISSQYEIKRQFQVNGFGIYNVDQPKIRPRGSIENIYVEGFDEKKIINRASYYLVNLKQNSLVSLYSSPKYFKARENILWAVIDEDKMIIASPEQIKTMKDKSLHLQIFSIKEGLEILGDVIASR